MPAKGPWLSTDISCLQGTQQQTCWPPLLLSIDGKDRWTRTPDCYIYPVLHNMQAASITQRSREHWTSVKHRDISMPSILPAGFRAPSTDAARWRRTYAIVPMLTTRGVSGWMVTWPFDVWSRSHSPSRGVGSQFTAALKGTWNMRPHQLRSTDWDKSSHAKKLPYVHHLLLVV